MPRTDLGAVRAICWQRGRPERGCRSLPGVDAWHLAQFNVAHLRAPLDHSDTAEFVANLDALNALAEAAPGFVWRLTDEHGQSSSYVVAYDDPHMIINLSVWASVEDLHRFVYRSGHGDVLRQRRQWFERMIEAFIVCWWLPAGTTPTVDESLDRLARLRRDGASDHAFTLRDARPTPSTVATD